MNTVSKLISSTILIAAVLGTAPGANAATGTIGKAAVAAADQAGPDARVDVRSGGRRSSGGRPPGHRRAGPRGNHDVILKGDWHFHIKPRHSKRDSRMLSRTHRRHRRGYLYGR